MAKRKAAAPESAVEAKVAKKTTTSPSKNEPTSQARKSSRNTETAKPAKTSSPTKLGASSSKAAQNGVKTKTKVASQRVTAPAKPSPSKPKQAKPVTAKQAKAAVNSSPSGKTKKPTPRGKSAVTKVKAAPVPKSASPAKKPKTAGKAIAKQPASKLKEADIKSSEDEAEPETKPAAVKVAPRKRTLKEKPKEKVVKELKKPKVELPKVEVPVRQTRGEGVVLTFGQGDVGQLGLGEDVLEKSRPAHVAGVEQVIDVHAGGMHTVCLTAKGEIYTFGCNDEGALGRDTSKEGSEFNADKVQLPGRAVQISAGDSHTAAVLEDGRLFVWGSFRDSHGTMGLTLSGSEKLPVQFLPDVPVVKVASGADHLVCLSYDGTVYTCGCAEQGQLGRVAGMFSNRGGRQGKRLLLSPQPVPLGKGKKKVVIDDIWTGSYCTFARAKETGLIYVFGLNNYNQLGVEENDVKFAPILADSFVGRKWKSISCGQHHTLALDDEGKVYSLGRKDYGRLGLGESASDVKEPTLISALKDHQITDVAAGECVSFAVAENGELYSWGMGTNGQLGHGNEDDLLEPAQVKGKQLEGKRVLAVSAGGQHTVVLAKSTEAAAVKENGQ